MGSIIHQGINFIYQVHFISIDEKECANWISFHVYLIRCIFAFYQLYMAFKYSNVSCSLYIFLILTVHFPS